MLAFWNITKGINELEEWRPSCWVQVTCPTDSDIKYLNEKLQLPDYFLSDIADTAERARYDYDDGWLMIILRIPQLKKTNSRSPYTTIPLGIVIKKDIIITICHQETGMLQDFINHHKRKDV